MFRHLHPGRPESFACTQVYGPRGDKMVFITSVEVIGPGRIRLAWDDGTVRDVDLPPLMTRHSALEALRDDELFRKVAIVLDGSGIGWPNGADFCAQALRELADQQSVAERERA